MSSKRILREKVTLNNKRSNVHKNALSSSELICMRSTYRKQY